MLLFCNKNKENPLSIDKFFEKKLNHPMELCFSTQNILTTGLIIPKMFENSQIPKELKGNKLKEKLNDYLQKQNTTNPNFKYTLNVKGNSEEIKKLTDITKKISQDAINRDDVFEIKV